MGALCGSESNDKDDQAVSQEIRADQNHSRNVIKLLLLGAGGSGKSTLFKQLQNIHGKGFAQRDRRTFRSQIYEQIFEAMKVMITKCEEYYEETNEEKWKISDDCEPSVVCILQIRNNQLNSEIAKHLGILWGDPAIQNVFKVRNKICVADSTGKFLDELNRISNPDYEPTDSDLLLVRYRTTGMAEKDFEMGSATFKICDVGGQRNERRKWIHFFENVTAVIFVASLSSYDEVPFEDETSNSMKESLEVFEEQLASHWFNETAFILFLNKSDVFKEKIQHVPLTYCFKEYDGKQDFDSSLEFIKDKFEKLNKDDTRQLYSHVTCATDPDNIQKVFADVQHIVIDWSLKKSGII